MEPIAVKCLLIGNTGVGKSCLRIRCAEKVFPDNVPTSYESYVTMTVDGKTVNLHIQEVPGDEEYSRFRRIFYPQTDVAVMCFAVNDIASFDRITEVPSARTDYKGSFFPQTITDWNALPDSIDSSAEGAKDSVAQFTTLLIDEFKEEYFSPEFPIMLVGLKEDLRSETGSPETSDFVTGGMMRDLFKKKGLKSTSVCSALTGEYVEDIFDNVICKYFKSIEMRGCHHHHHHRTYFFGCCNCRCTVV